MEYDYMIVKCFVNKYITDSYGGDLNYRYEIIKGGINLGRVIREHGSWNIYFCNPNHAYTQNSMDKILKSIKDKLESKENYVELKGMKNL